jgi:uncharacterized iron-regulated membrane protein
MLSFTGIFLAFPEAGRAAVGALTPVSPSARGLRAPESRGRPITPDDAVALARAQLPDAAVVGVGMPAGPRGVYRIALREPPDDGERGGAVVFVDPRAATVLRRIDRTTQTSGDAFLAISARCTKAMRWDSPGASSSAALDCYPRSSS